MTIYLDVIFLENFILNFIILYAVGIATKSKINFLRLIIGSIIGGIYVIIYYIIKMEILMNIVMKIGLSIIIIYISFNSENYKVLIKQLLCFYLTSFVFAGGALAVIYIANSGKISMINGMIIGKYSFIVIFIGTLLTFIGIVIAFKLIKSRITKKDFFCNLTIKVNNKLINTIAMIDTGNLLKEPITNIPVIVVEDSIAKKIIPVEILNNSQNILKGNLENLSEITKKEYLAKLKLIPFMSLGKQNGIILGIKAEEVIVKTENENKVIERAIIGLYEKKLSRNGNYKALIGLIW